MVSGLLVFGRNAANTLLMQRVEFYTNIHRAGLRRSRYCVSWNVGFAFQATLHSTGETPYIVNISALLSEASLLFVKMSVH